MHETLTASRRTAAEDIQPGDYVALLRVVCEFPSFLWRDDCGKTVPEDPVRIPLLPPDNCQPLLVKQICLPFVFVETPNGSFETLDLRRCEVTKLDSDFGRVVSKQLKKSAREFLRTLFPKPQRKRKKHKRRR